MLSKSSQLAEDKSHRIHMLGFRISHFHTKITHQLSTLLL